MHNLVFLKHKTHTKFWTHAKFWTHVNPRPKMYWPMPKFYKPTWSTQLFDPHTHAPTRPTQSTNSRDLADLFSYILKIEKSPITADIQKMKGMRDFHNMSKHVFCDFWDDWEHSLFVRRKTQNFWAQVFLVLYLLNDTLNETKTNQLVFKAWISAANMNKFCTSHGQRCKDYMQNSFSKTYQKISG